MNNRIISTDDDDYPPISRETLVKLTELAARVEEAGGINVLSDSDVEALKTVAAVLSKAGVMEFLEAQHHRFEASRHWQKVRERIWRIIMVLAGMAAAVAVFVSQIDGAVKAVRGWLKSVSG